MGTLTPQFGTILPSQKQELLNSNYLKEYINLFFDRFNPVYKKTNQKFYKNYTNLIEEKNNDRTLVQQKM